MDIKKVIENGIEYDVHTFNDGDVEWWYNGHRSRENGPAMTLKDGTQQWLKDGHYHRTGDLPAVITHGGTKKWYIDGKLHRENGPALISGKGTKKWYMHDVLHNTDGHAVEWQRNRTSPNGQREWWYRGRLVYNDTLDYTTDFDKGEISDKMWMEIIKHKLKR